RDAQLAANYKILGFRVADYVDALDIYVGAFLDGESDPNRAAGSVAYRHRAHLQRGVALIAQRQRHLLHRLVNLLLAEGSPGPDQNGGLQLRRIDLGNVRLDGGGAERIALTLLDGELHAISGTLLVFLRVDCDYARIGKSVL